jgi:hypothetical protein
MKSKKRLFALFILLCHLFFAEAADPGLQELIGRRYTGLKDFPVLDDFRNIGNILVEKENIFSRDRETFHRLFVFRKENTGLLILMRYVPDNTGTVIHVADLIEVEGMDQEKYLGYGGSCRLNRKVDDRIIALFKIESNKKKIFRKIYKAWRIDTAAGKMNEIPVKGIDFINSDYEAD